VFADAPLVVVANRDEGVDRSSLPPERVDDERTVIAPRDEEAGGTWIGYNDGGLFAGIANRWVDDPPAGERSRGLLLRDVLRQDTAVAAARTVEREVSNRQYEPFTIVVADALAGLEDPGPGANPVPDQDRDDPVSAILLEYDGGLGSRVLEPGVHVVVNVGTDGNYHIPGSRPEPGRRQAENADELRADLAPEPGETATAWRERARAAISDHEYGVCIHGDGFGTRSSSVLSFGEGGVRYEFADGPPCETDYEDVGAGL
jgi:hypothetical protein